jgi:hypothetical protein
VSYSLDDVVLPREARSVKGGRVLWIAAGHATWVIVFAALGSTAGVSRLLPAGAVAQLAGLVLVVVAWVRRLRSEGVARAVAWVSTILLGSAVACVGFAMVVTISASFGHYDEAIAKLVAVFVPALFALEVLVAVPTIGGFVAAIGVARDLRRS